MTTPVAFLPDTPTLEEALARVTRQFALDGLNVIRAELIGYGRFIVHLPITSHVYEWSHVNGTRRVY